MVLKATCEIPWLRSDWTTKNHSELGLTFPSSVVCENFLTFMCMYVLVLFFESIYNASCQVMLFGDIIKGLYM